LNNGCSEDYESEAMLRHFQGRGRGVERIRKGEVEKQRPVSNVLEIAARHEYPMLD